MEVKEVPRIILRGDEEAASLLVREGIRQLGILKDLMKFQNLKQDVRRVRYTDGSEIVCRSIHGIEDVQIYVPSEFKEKEEQFKLYVYVTISDWVTIWDLETGEVATDVFNNEGCFLRFPCHKSKLEEWLKGIVDRPTRQVLKEDPKDRQDYLEDNGKDIGNENRVEVACEWDPSIGCYFGVREPCGYTNIVQDVHIDTYGQGYPYKQCSLLEKDTPHLDTIVGCDSEVCNKSFYASMEGIYVVSSKCLYHRDNSVRYYEPYHRRSKRLYLCPYPSPIYIRPGFPPKGIAYTISKCSPYSRPIVFKTSTAHAICGEGYNTWDWPLTFTLRESYIYVFSTVLGNLGPEEPDDLYSTVHQGLDFESDCFGISFPEGSNTSLCMFEARRELWEGCLNSDAEHSAMELNWCWAEARGLSDIEESESNRLGVSWCGSPSPEEKKGWYRVLLRFCMSCYHSGGHSALRSYDDNPMYCPNQAMCDDVPEPLVCIVTSWINKPSERTSSVQATIELERPEDYPKNIDTTKYERPEDYNSDPDGTEFCIDKKYSELCAFPGRDKGYEERDGKCFPFDGTYIIYSLGKAVEKLINEHYEDGSDDPLIVYLLKRPY